MEERNPNEMTESFVSENAESLSLQEEIPTAPRPKKRRSGALSVVLVVLLSILLFISGTLSLGLVSARRILSKDGVSQILDNLISGETVKEIVGEEFSYDEFYDEIREEVQTHYNIEVSREKIDEIVEASGVSDFFAEKVSQYAQALLSGEEFSLTEEELRDVIVANADKISEAVGEPVSEEFLQEVTQPFVDESVLDAFSVEKGPQIPPEVLTVGRTVLSNVTVGFFCLISAVWIFLMILRDPAKGCVGTGITFLILGGLFMAICALPGLLMGDSGAWVTAILDVNTLLYVGVMIVGVLAIGGGILISILRRRKAKRQAEIFVS